MIIAFELANLNDLNYSFTFDDSYSLLNLYVTEQCTDSLFYIGSLCKGHLQTHLMLAYPLKGMTLCPSFC